MQFKRSHVNTFGRELVVCSLVFLPFLWLCGGPLDFEVSKLRSNPVARRKLQRRIVRPVQQVPGSVCAKNWKQRSETSRFESKSSASDAAVGRLTGGFPSVQFAIPAIRARIDKCAKRLLRDSLNREPEETIASSESPDRRPIAILPSLSAISRSLTSGNCKLLNRLTIDTEHLANEFRSNRNFISTHDSRHCAQNSETKIKLEIKRHSDQTTANQLRIKRSNRLRRQPLK